MRCHVSVTVRSAAFQRRVLSLEKSCSIGLRSGRVRRQEQKLGAGGPDVEIELVAPLNDQSPIKRLLGKGGGVYHLCYEAADLDSAIAKLVAAGCLVVSQPVPAVAFSGRRIAWLYSPLRQLFELVEAQHL
jgi:hypothetical protein